MEPKMRALAARISYGWFFLGTGLLCGIGAVIVMLIARYADQDPLLAVACALLLSGVSSAIIGIILIALGDLVKSIVAVVLVVAVLGLGCGWASLRAYRHEKERQQHVRTAVMLYVVMRAVAAYYDEQKAYPPDAGGGAGSTAALAICLRRSPRAAEELILPPKFLRPTTGGPVILDSYGREMRYLRSNRGVGPALISAGPDGVFGSDDDIRRELRQEVGQTGEERQ